MPQSSSGCSIATHPGDAGNKTILYVYDEHHRDDRRNLGTGRSRNTHTRLLLGARRSGPLGAETLPLDLMRLENVRSFASAVDRELGSPQINSLVPN
jgi:hypothetical protein